LGSKKYNLQKDSDMRQLSDFLSSYHPLHSLDDCTPQQIADYVIFRTQLPNVGKGRTVVHSTDCPHIMSSKSPACSCPVHGKHSSVEQLVKHLQVQFGEHRSKQQWEQQSQSGNPAKSRLISNLLLAIDDEQKLAHVTTSQPVMISYDKLRAQCRYLRQLSLDLTISPADRWRVNRLRSSMLVSYQTWARCGNINKLLTLAVLKLPGTGMLIFGHTWGKTISSGKEHLCGVKPSSQVEMCAVAATIDFHGSYLECQSSAAPGFLYRVNPQSDKHVPAPTLQADFLKYLKLQGAYCGEQFSSLRASGATQALVTGASLQAMMQTANWASPQTFAHYTHLQELLGLQEVPNIMSQPQQPLHHIEQLQSLMCAFPANTTV
jgi:hypothetical protein